ncbi:MAG TPA: protein kinase [Myxococcales bacterium]|jgi:serine/threonine-protein kinase
MPIERFGKYQLERSLAQGGMAEIFLARQSGPVGFQKVVVIKKVLPQLAADETFQEMFLDEARIAARLDHPGIVQIFDFGETDGSYFIAMEYLAGEDFAALLKAELGRRNTLPPFIAARLLSAVCDALHYAHTFVDENNRPLNIIHRDISPSNLFLTYAGAVKVLDFGLAKAEGKKVQTMDGQIKGKFQYMSPEQILGEKVDARSDVFALGAVLHELVAGQPTFLRSDPVLIFRAITEEPIIPLTDLVPGIGEDFAGIAAKALERDPAKRFQSALEMRKALDAFLATNAALSSAGQLQDYIRELIPAEQIQKKTRPLANSTPSQQDEGDAEFDGAPTARRLLVVDETGEPAKVASTHLRLSPLSPADLEQTPADASMAQSPRPGSASAAEDDAGATVLEAPAFKRPQMVVAPPKAKLRTSKMMQQLKVPPPDEPEVERDGPPTDRGIEVGSLEVEPEISTNPTRPSHPGLQMPVGESQSGPRSWPTVDLNETTPEGGPSPMAVASRTSIIEAAGGADDAPKGLLAKVGLNTTRDVVLAGVGVGFLLVAVAVLLKLVL